MEKKGFTPHALSLKKKASSKPQKKGRGFTIIEISVVIAIISLLSLITIPALVNYQKTTKLRSEARLLATNLRYAQQLAITEQNIYSVKFFTSTDSYQIVNENTGEIIINIILDSAVDISIINSFTNDTAQFNPTGAAVETGSIVLTNTKNQTSTIEIKPSGYVEITEQL